MASQVPPLPLAVQVGFAGSRSLFDPAGAEGDPLAMRAAVLEQMQTLLHGLPHELGLSDQHFLVGVSSLAIGADVLFTTALSRLAWSQRVFLPQGRTEFLSAQGSKGPDFDAAERLTAQDLFASPHIIEESVVSTADDRPSRFEDVNLKIVAESDLLICLRREDRADQQRGGTVQAIKRALARGKPVLELVLTRDASGTVSLLPHWHGRENFQRPELPDQFQALTPLLPLENGQPPDGAAFVGQLKSHASSKAAHRSGWFKRAAFVIVGTHVVATLLAVLAIKLMGSAYSAVVPWILGIELVLLAAGLGTHQWLHRTLATPSWAMARLCAEVARSVSALRGLPASLRHLETLPFPRELHALLRTLNVMHLRDSRQMSEPWATTRARYLGRLSDKGSGQADYYRRQYEHAHRWHQRASRLFATCSLLAIAATLSKLLHLPLGETGTKSLEFSAGVLAVWLPVVAVGVMSLVAALDLEARVHTFEEMSEFLEVQTVQIEAAVSNREFADLALATELRLLGEMLNWSVRRRFIGVA
jgi:hypothetical protein